MTRFHDIKHFEVHRPYHDRSITQSACGATCFDLTRNLRAVNCKRCRKTAQFELALAAAREPKAAETA